MSKIVESLNSKNFDLPEVSEACIKSAEVVSDIIIKFSFLTECDFLDAFKEVVSLLVTFTRSQYVTKFKIALMIKDHFNILLKIYDGLAQTKSSEYARECGQELPALLEVVCFIMCSSPANEIQSVYKIFQKILYLIVPNEHSPEKIVQVYQRMFDIEKVIMLVNDENLSLGYVEMIGKLLLTHIERLEEEARNQILVSFYQKFLEIFNFTQQKRMKTLVKLF